MILIRGLDSCGYRWAAENGLTPSRFRMVRELADIRGRRGARLVMLGCAHLARGHLHWADVQHLELAVEDARCP